MISMFMVYIFSSLVKTGVYKQNTVNVYIKVIVYLPVYSTLKNGAVETL